MHTPYSILNNQFGFNPNPKWKTDIAEFDNYVKTLFTKAVEKEIIAIIYFCFAISRIPQSHVLS